MSEDEPEYELIMPFVTVTSKGGPHDDDSYTAGWEMGALDQLFTDLGVIGERTFVQVIRLDNVPQADLIAMENGYKMTTVYDEDAVEGWTTVRFTSNGLVAQEEP